MIGLGVGAAHARAYAREPRCRLAALCDLSGVRLAEVARELGVEDVRLSLDPQVLLDDGELDAVSIASYDDAHFAQALAALEAGKHVFCEKPLCRGEEEARALHGAWVAAGQPALRSNLVLRSAPLFGWLRDAVERGELGSIYAFDGHYLYGRLLKITEGWRRDVPDYSVMLGGGIHLVDLALWITGERPHAVTAVGNRITTEGTAFRYDDYVAATFEFPSGLAARVTANFGSVHRHQHVVRVSGTKGTFLYDDAGARLHVERDPASTPRQLPYAPLPASKGELIPAFVDDVVSGEGRREAAVHELAVVAACAACDRALATGGRVEIEHF